VAAVDGFVGPLEQALLAVNDQLDAGLAAVGRKVGQQRGRHHHRGADVVFHLHLLGRDEILAQLEDAPGAVLLEADAQVGADQLAIIDLELVAGLAVDEVDREMAAPVRAPFGPAHALDDESHRQDAVGKTVQPGVVVVGEVGRRRQHADHRAEAAIVAEDGAADVAVFLFAAGPEAPGEVVGEDAFHQVEILLDVGDEQRAVDHRVAERLGYFRLTAAGDGAGLVAENAFGIGADQPPGRRAWVFLHFQLVAIGLDVGLAGTQLDRLPAAVRFPVDGLRREVHMHRRRQVNHLGMAVIDGVAFGLHLHHRAVALHHVGEAVARTVRLRGVFIAVVTPLEGQGTAGVFLLGQTEQVGGIADLGLDLFLAVAVIVVGDDGDDDAALVAGGDLERRTFVVKLGGIAPAHAVGALALAGVLPAGQAEGLLAQLVEVRRQDHAAAMARPVVDVQPGVVLRQHRVAAVAENAFNEIEVAHQTAGREETDFHALFRLEARNLGADQRTQQQGDEHLHLAGLADGEGQAQQVLRRIQRLAQQAGKRNSRDGLLVAGHGQAIVADVE